MRVFHWSLPGCALVFVLAAASAPAQCVVVGVGAGSPAPEVGGLGDLAAAAAELSASGRVVALSPDGEALAAGQPLRRGIPDLVEGASESRMFAAAVALAPLGLPRPGVELGGRVVRAEALPRETAQAAVVLCPQGPDAPGLKGTPPDCEVSVVSSWMACLRDSTGATIVLREAALGPPTPPAVGAAPLSGSPLWHARVGLPDLDWTHRRVSIEPGLYALADLCSALTATAGFALHAAPDVSERNVYCAAQDAEVGNVLWAAEVALGCFPRPLPTADPDEVFISDDPPPGLAAGACMVFRAAAQGCPSPFGLVRAAGMDADASAWAAHGLAPVSYRLADLPLLHREWIGARLQREEHATGRSGVAVDEGVVITWFYAVTVSSAAVSEQGSTRAVSADVVVPVLAAH